MLRVVLLLLLALPTASACSFSSPPEPPGRFMVWDIREARAVASFEVWARQGAVADCSLTNPMAFDGKRIAWAEGSDVHVAGLDGGRWSVAMPFEPRRVDLAGDVVLALRPGRDGDPDRIHAATLEGGEVAAHLPEGWRVTVLRDGLAPAQQGNLTRLWDVLDGSWASPARDLRREGPVSDLEAVHFDRARVAVVGRETSTLTRWDTGGSTTWPHRIEALDGDTVWVRSKGIAAHTTDGRLLSDHQGVFMPFNEGLRDGMLVLNEYTGPVREPVTSPSTHQGTAVTTMFTTGASSEPRAAPTEGALAFLGAMASLAWTARRRRGQ